MKKIKIALLIVVCSMVGCGDYLDVIPDNVVTIDNAFTLRNEAEKYLFTCYSYMPLGGAPEWNPEFLAGDESWLPTEFLRGFSESAANIARGNQNKVDPYMNFWDGYNGGKALWGGIRDCNIFIENVSDLNKVPDLDLAERERWLAEVKFLKAYYHFYLLRMYGPIPIVDTNLPISASPEEVKVRRRPVDEVVDYIAALLDEAAAKLPERIQNEGTELGRITRPIALAIKARLLVMAASPLFNGNPDYASFTNHDGEQLFNPAEDMTKWQRALTACEEAISVCTGAGIQLYEYPGALFSLSDTTATQMSIREAVCEKWNSEIIWGLSSSRTYYLQSVIMAHIDPDAASSFHETRLSATMKIVEMFYTHHGVPINEDKTLDFSDKTALRTATHDERFNLIEGYETARINFDREPRFYASLGFVGCVWYMNNSPSNTDEDTWTLDLESTASFPAQTGYYIKKLVHPDFEFLSGSDLYIEEYPWPEMRLADLLLLYAEAKNEVDGPGPDVYKYLNEIRDRAGLPSVEESWTTYSTSPSKYTTQAGLRDIIHRERLIELAFEGTRLWDLRRWKEAVTELNKPVYGWDIDQNEPDFYFRYKQIHDQTFVAPRDYFWPIRDYNLTVNDNLVQNLGW